MKKQQFILIFIAHLSLMYATSLHAASIYGGSIDITPTTPDINDFLVANISGSYGSAGYIFENAQLQSISNDTVNIDLFIDAPNGPSLTVISDFFYSVNLGPLSAGTYTISADFYFDGNLENTIVNTFEVSAVPIPAAAWLFLTGLISIFSISFFNKAPNK